MTKAPINSLIQTGFQPQPNAQTRIWNRLHQRRNPSWEMPAWRWGLSVCLTVLVVWASILLMRPEPEPMLASLSATSLNSQRYAEAGPRGLEYNAHYIPFQ